MTRSIHSTDDTAVVAGVALLADGEPPGCAAGWRWPRCGRGACGVRAARAAGAHAGSAAASAACCWSARSGSRRGDLAGEVERRIDDAQGAFEGEHSAGEHGHRAPGMARPWRTMMSRIALMALRVEAPAWRRLGEHQADVGLEPPAVARLVASTELPNPAGARITGSLSWNPIAIPASTRGSGGGLGRRRRSRGTRAIPRGRRRCSRDGGRRGTGHRGGPGRGTNAAGGQARVGGRDRRRPHGGVVGNGDAVDRLHDQDAARRQRLEDRAGR